MTRLLLRLRSELMLARADCEMEKRSAVRPWPKLVRALERHPSRDSPQLTCIEDIKDAWLVVDDELLAIRVLDLG